MTSENRYEEAQSQKLRLEHSPRGFLIHAPSPGKGHLFASVLYQATVRRLQLVQTFTAFHVTTTVRTHFCLQQKQRMK